MGVLQHSSLLQMNYYTRMNPRGRLRRRRNLRVPTIDEMPIGSQKWSSSALNDGRDPLFSTIFSRTCDRSSIDLVQKCSVIFLMTTPPPDRIWARSEPRDPRFSTSKTALRPQVAQKSGSESVRSILLRSCLKSTSGTLTRLHSFEIAPAAQ